MLNSKFDINSPEWIERVFENRNKSYGAYDLRKNYGVNLLKAFGITLFSIAVIVGVVSYFLGKAPASVSTKIIDVSNRRLTVAPDGTIKKSNHNTGAGNPDNSGGDDDDETVHGGEVQVKPMVVGGKETWVNFLEKNLHYPEDARYDHLSGSVLTSFIVERDGHISNIKIEEPAGHGFDEEAMRVLNLSPAWTPGRENGKPVRVKFTMPINFRMARK